MNTQSMTIKRRILLGFGLAFALLCLVAVPSFQGVKSIVQNAGQVIDGNKLDVVLAQKEVDHLNWAIQVATLFSDDSVRSLSVEMDPHRCALGLWLDGSERRTAETQVPALVELVRDLEEPHRQLHQSAVRIAEIYRKPHAGLALTLANLLNDHLQWVNTVALKLTAARQGQTGATSDLKNFAFGVQTDPTQCVFGKFQSDPATASLAEEFPALKKALEQCRQPHEQLHQSAINLELQVRAGNTADAIAQFQTNTLSCLKQVQQHIGEAIAAERALQDAAQEARAIYSSQTVPALGKVQSGLLEIRSAARASTLNDQAMLKAAASTKRNVTAVSLVALAAGIALAWLISRSTSQRLNVVADGLATASEQLASAASEIASASQTLAQGATEQAASLQETSASLEEMTSIVHRNAEAAQQAKELADVTRAAADTGTTEVEEMKNAMNAIKTSSGEVAKIVKDIDEIAFQTNILALNAAVEAARAGEAGMGFAVVADEVRNLAQRSAKSAKETAAKIEDAIAKSERGMQISAKVAASFGQIVTKTRDVDRYVGEIAAASSEQSQGISQIDTAITQMDKVTQSNASSAEESAAAAEELDAQAQTLKESVVSLLQLVGSENKVSTAPTPAAAPGLEAAAAAAPAAKPTLVTKKNGAAEIHRPAAPASGSTGARQRPTSKEGALTNFWLKEQKPPV